MSVEERDRLEAQLLAVPGIQREIAKYEGIVRKLSTESFYALFIVTRREADRRVEVSRRVPGKINR